MGETMVNNSMLDGPRGTLNRIAESQRLMVHGQDVAWMLDRWAARTPNKTFLIWEPFDGDPKRWTYMGMKEDADRFAAALLERGISSGDRLLVHMENCPEFLITIFACARIGVVAVTTNTRSVARDIEYYVDAADITAAITQPAFASMIADSAPGLNFIIVTEDDSGAATPEFNSSDYIPFDACLSPRPAPPRRAPDASADFLIQFTSGTTSRPKPVLLTHGNFIWGAQMNARNFLVSSEDTALVFSPLFHINAVSYSTMTTLWVGGTIVLQPRLSVSRFWDVSIRNKCTWTFVIPFLVYPLLQRESPTNHHYRFWMIGGYSTPLRKKFGIDVVCAWGMTETITQGIISNFHQPPPEGSIGRAAPCYDIEVRDEKGNPVGPGEQGTLFVRGVPGVSLFKEYFNDSEATRDVVDEEGWLKTGDMISIDQEGYLYFLGRDKDMLKVGAENVASSEIETVIMKTGLVEECAVVGRKHYMLDEVPVVFVIAKPGDQDDIRDGIIAACKRDLADFKVVKEVIFVDDFPRATLDKIVKPKLRKQLTPIGPDNDYCK
ncbi:class I adenylate-forming enzyme family protein [Hyphococcus luteus]|uniref:ATP-dependent acyl-CoA ligase n=1 Tax=Hyphococcus luteus TaxID=2058213 RepID=A0A2S7K4F7_9PROT|nr:class I adenylate-forming enzyme family protein [Marinicaulis flavus]PQA87387.1 ATP-dependent acyl-CoA ligase [Marinicaulis flavus]